MRTLPEPLQSDVGMVASPVTVPLCVDLDGTLVRTDMILETAVERLRTAPFEVFLWPIWLLRGRVEFKARLARGSTFDPALLPYDPRVLAYLRAERQRGRRLLLVTASHRQVADRIAAHLGLFDEVIATENGRNLKGKTKAAVLLSRFGERGFSYMGNDRSDLPVWQVARSIGTVNTAQAVLSSLPGHTRIEASFPREKGVLVNVVRSLRLYQWIKNTLVFVPALAAHVLDRPDVLPAVGALFLAFGFVASGSYILNDLLDLENDRRHPRKRLRPFASGAIPLTAGLAGPILMATGVLVAAAVSALAAWIVIGYLILATSYSMFLKRWPLVDVFTLAVLYSLRILAGGVAAGVAVSNWLLTFSSFLFLALGLMKRSAELQGWPAGHRGGSARGYGAEDVQMLKIMGVASSCTAAIVLALYVDTGVAHAQYRLPSMLWGLVPLCLFWQWRLWLATNRGYMHDDPIVFAARDWVSWAVAFSALGLVAVATVGLEWITK